MPEISFSVSARTARLIGQENFANADGAVVELVKNCYDADALNSIVFFDNTDEDIANHVLYVIDNGIGMTDTIIKDYWMMIGTDNKEVDFESAAGRVKTGAKGIGRFALDRLGNIAEMYTLQKEQTDGFFWKVNWDDFKKSGVSISDVKATLDTLPTFDYKAKLIEIASTFPPLLDYVEDKKFENGTLILIKGLRDKWDQDDIARLFSNLEILIPPKEQPDFKVAMYSRWAESLYGELAGAYYDDYDYKLVGDYDGNKDQVVSVTITRNELDKPRVEKDFHQVFDMPLMKEPFWGKESFLKETIDYPILLSELVKGYVENNSDEVLKKIGKFKFTFYFLKNTRSDNKSEDNLEKYPYKNFNSSNRKAWLKKFGGVKIFRDEFRVRPYGEYGEDWLRLGERQSKNPQGAGQRIGSYRIGPNQISGTISISRLTNLSFQDKSGREGIQENEVFDLFKVVIISLINQFEKDRNVIMYSFSELYKIQKKIEEETAKAEELANQILEQQKKKEESQNSQVNNTPNITTISKKSEEPSETEVVLAKGVKAKDEEIQNKEEEIRLLRSLSGTGLIVASVAHELRSLRSLLVSRTEDLKKVLDKLIDQKLIKNLKSYEDPYTMLNHMRDQDVQIKHWLDYSLSALKRDRRTRTNLNLSNYFESYSANWESVCSRRKVALKIQNCLSENLNIRAFTIDFDTVFNNLLVNAFDSFKRKNDNEPRVVSLTLEKGDKGLIILFADNGAGLSKDFSKNPNEIFLPFETSKVDRKGNKIGTGMGMYLVKSIVDDYKGEISIVPVTEGFSLEINLPLRSNA